ncbi:hypothetical protein FF2_020048 [Malus domestica]
MVEKRGRTRQLKIAQFSGHRKTQSGEHRGKRCSWGRVGLCHPQRVGARDKPKNYFKNLSTFVTSSDTYPEDERIQGRHGGYDPSTYQ